MIINLDINTVPSKEAVLLNVAASETIHKRIGFSLLFGCLWFLSTTAFAMTISPDVLTTLIKAIYVSIVLAGFIPLVVCELINRKQFNNLGINSPYLDNLDTASFIDMFQETYANTLAELCLNYQEIKLYIEAVNKQQRQLLREEFQYLTRYANDKANSDNKAILKSLGNPTNFQSE